MAPLRAAMANGASLLVKELARPGWTHGLKIRQVPPPETRPAFLAHARLRRTSPITHHVVASALEAIGTDAPLVASQTLRLGVVFCAMSGCVNYSRRFYDEVLHDPATASPLVFPETVFNAPASHIAAFLGTPAMNYTLVGDPAAFLDGVAVAANWLLEDRVDGCLVIGAEESDWLTSDAFRLFSRQLILSDGAGALYLKRTREGALAELGAITDPHLFVQKQCRTAAVKSARAQLPGVGAKEILVDGRQGVVRLDAAETAAWQDWTGARISPKRILGEGLMAAAAWQCVSAIDALREMSYTVASVSVAGYNQQAIGARFLGIKN
jgi:hypothetical protein